MHRDRATLRVGDVFVKVDADQANLDAEAGAMARVPVPTPRILWQKPSCSPSRPCAARLSVASVSLRRFDLGTLTLGHQERLSEVLQGYGGGVDVEILRAWWSRRSLLAIRWLLEYGFDPFSPGCEVDVLRAQGDGRQDLAVPAP